MWCAFNKELAQLQLDDIRLRSYAGGPGKAELSDFLFRLPVHLNAVPKAKQLRPLFSTGYRGTVTGWPLVDALGLNVMPSVGPLNAVDVVQALKEQRRTAWVEMPD